MQEGANNTGVGPATTIQSYLRCWNGLCRWVASCANSLIEYSQAISDNRLTCWPLEAKRLNELRQSAGFHQHWLMLTDNDLLTVPLRVIRETIV